jgi:hypothetical protein
MAVRDAIQHAQEQLDRLSEDQLPDQEEYLMLLGNLQAELKHEYERRGKNGERLILYDLLIGKIRFKKL